MMWERIARAWSWEPSVVLGCLGLLAIYFWAVPAGRAKARMSYVAGVLVLVLALVSPLDVLSDTYLFSAHMLQHLLLILIVPPLLLAGLPAAAIARFDGSALGRVARHATDPLPAWVIGVGTMWIWHAPGLYNLTLASEPIHVVEHLSFLASAVVFWRPVIAPPTGQRTPVILAYLFLAAMASSVLGIMLTFAPVGAYAAYLAPADPLGILPALRTSGLSPALDQQLGGLFMWIPGSLVYLVFLLATLSRWYAAPEHGFASGQHRPV